VRILRGALAGAIAGLVGAYAMERFQAIWSETQKRARPKQTASAAKDEPTTVKAAERIAETVLHTELPEELKPAAGEAVHYGMGMLSGAIYGAVAEVLPIVRAGNGLLFGAVLWLIADETAVSATGLAKRPSAYPPSAHAYALSSHLVYGFVTETVRRVLRLVP
jgi:putative membrane protein